MARVTLYTQDGCSFCEDQRRKLEQGDDRITEVNLTRAPQAMTELLKLTEGRRIVPVVVRGADVQVAPEGGSEID